MNPNLHDLAARSWVHASHRYSTPLDGQVKIASFILSLAGVTFFGMAALLLYIFL